MRIFGERVKGSCGKPQRIEATPFDAIGLLLRMAFLSNEVRGEVHICLSSFGVGQNNWEASRHCTTPGSRDTAVQSPAQQPYKQPETMPLPYRQGYNRLWG